MTENGFSYDDDDDDDDGGGGCKIRFLISVNGYLTNPFALPKVCCLRRP